jgi:hypothetical protein
LRHYVARRTLQSQYDAALARRALGKKLEREVLPADKAA